MDCNRICCASFFNNAFGNYISGLQKEFLAHVPEKINTISNFKVYIVSVLGAIWSFMKVIFFIPSQTFFYVLELYLPKVYSFFELDCNSGMCLGGFFFCTLFWMIVWNCSFHDN